MRYHYSSDSSSDDDNDDRQSSMSGSLSDVEDDLSPDASDRQSSMSGSLSDVEDDPSPDESDRESSMSGSLSDAQDDLSSVSEHSLHKRCDLDETSIIDSDVTADADDDIDMLTDTISTYHLDGGSPTVGTADEPSNTSVSYEYQQYRIAPLECGFATPSADELRALGFTESHIKLVNSLASRGNMGILPISWKMGLFSLPQEFFTHDHNSVLQSHDTSAYAGERAFTRMLGLVGLARGDFSTGRSLEVRIGKFVRDYMRWTLKDAGLDKHTALPIVRVITAAEAADDEEVVARATQSLIRLSIRYQTALAGLATPSDTMASRGAYKIPTLYVLVAKHNKVALATMKPNDASQTLLPTALFELDDPPNDFWTSLALAMILCHARDMQMSFAQETGIGLGFCLKCQKEKEHDPDL